MSLKNTLSEYGFKSVSLYFSGSCNLDCTYCFQPKISGHMTEVNRDILDWITSGKCKDDILKYFGEGLESIALWGGEPSLNLPCFIDVLESYYLTFPNLNFFSYSTNISTKALAKNSLNFIKEVGRLNEKYKRNVRVDLQFSVDGPPELSDKSRKGSTVTSILENITYLLTAIQKDDRCKKCSSFHFKSTLDSESLVWLLKTNNVYGTNLNYFYHFFDDKLASWREAGIEKLPSAAAYLTFVFPGKYTQEDGKNCAEIHKILFSEDFRNQNWKVFNRNSVLTSQLIDMFRKPFSALSRGQRRQDHTEFIGSMNCGAGKGMLGLTHDGKLSACHAAFFLDPEALEYVRKNNLITSFEELNGFSFRTFEHYAKDNLVTEIDDKLRTARNLKNFKEFNAELKGRYQFLEMMISHLALAGLISPCYLEDSWRHFAASTYLFSGHSCPSNNILEFGSLYILSASHLKLFCNGALELISNEYKKGNL